MSKFEEVIKMIYRLYRKKQNQSDTPCPNEETLVNFSEGALSKDELKKVQEHLISCQRCAEIVSLFCRQFEEKIEVPEFLIQKAKSLVGQGAVSNILEVILVLKEKALQIIGTTGDVILDNEIIPMPILRSREISEFPEEIKLIKEFEDIKVALNIHRRYKDKIRININMLDRKSLSPLSNLRIVLLKGAQELESYESASGSAVFDKVATGSYVIRIMRGENKLGSINLEIK